MTRARVYKLNRIKAVLAEQDVSQKELAAKLGISVNSITRYCNHSVQPPLIMLFLIAQALDVDMRELIISTKSGSK
ncbi:helix-turn-helix transcriptional regulator [Chitinophaga sp. CC14]|uniref:helix-turn-helix domain-containing protein n=1 Tax=Chitinophaga sp. CC14 TaxID=3029199 RepID=UPI003B77267F